MLDLLAPALLAEGPIEVLRQRQHCPAPPVVAKRSDIALLPPPTIPFKPTATADILERCHSAWLSIMALSMVINVLVLTGPLYMLQVYDRVLQGRSVETLVYLTVICAGALAVYGALDVVRARILVRVGLWLDRVASPAALELPPESSQEALRHLGTLRNYLSGGGVAAMCDLPWVPIYLLVIFVLHPLLGWFSVIGTVILLVLALIQYANTSRRSVKVAAASKQANQVLLVPKHTAMSLQKWDDANARTLELQTALLDRSMLITGITKATRMFLQMAILGLGAWLVIQNELSAGVMIAASIIMTRALAPVEQAAAGWSQASAARRSWKWLRDIPTGQSRFNLFDYQSDVPKRPPIGGCVLAGWAVIVFFVGAFGVWAWYAPLTSSAQAGGVVKVDTDRKTVQHLEGGIVKEILVKDGAAVKHGQVLVRLDITADEADLNAIEEDILALEAETTSLKAQLPSLQEQVRDQEQLYAKGYARKPDLYELRRTADKLVGDIKSNENKLLGLREREHKQRDKIARDEVLAPQDGVVIGLKVHNVGAVLQPGGAILDLVPSNDKLVLEVKVSPMDIDVVHPDLPAMVRFISYKQRVTPMVNGAVTRVSPDVVVDEHSGSSYYYANVEVDKKEMARVPNVRLYPGMPVQASIITGRRTLLDYLLQPVTDSFARAFQEN